jgi:acetyl-CoA C-acetyltransferase
MNIDGLDARMPILVGWSAVSQRDEDPRRAREALTLMIEASVQAGMRCGQPSLLKSVDRIYVPKGRWSYVNPAAGIRQAIGADRAVTVLSSVGVLQQSLIGDACQRIQDGSIETALVVGADTGYRTLRSSVTGIPVSEDQQTNPYNPDILLSPHEELRHPAELRVGLQMPVGLYAILHSAFQARLGGSLESYLSRIAATSSDLSKIAQHNPQSWKKAFVLPDEIRFPSRGNSMQAFPYTKLHCSNWSVDQAAALIMTSVGKARQLGVPSNKWIFPVVSTESNHMMQVSTRPELDRCLGAKIAGEYALTCAGIDKDELDFTELYSCFPAAIEFFAAELGIPLDRQLTITGGMPFAGGPYNNYVLQATSRMADLLSDQNQSHGEGARRRTGLISCVSGVLTKQAFAIWSNRPPKNRFSSRDLTGSVKRAARPRQVSTDFSGHASVAGYTTLYEKGTAAKGVIIADVDDGRRVVAQTFEPSLISQMETTLFCGSRVNISDGVTFSRIS